MWWIDTFADAPTFSSPTSSSQTGTMHASAMNWAYCKMLGREISDDYGAHNHWWLLVDPDTGPIQQWMSAYYLRNWGNDQAGDNYGSEIPDCPGTTPSPPPPPPPPPPAPPPAQLWWVDTFATANVYDSPWSWNATGTLYAGTNYVYCKAAGPDFSDGWAHNYWWLLTDPDVGPSGQWVPAYYLSRWGDNEAFDNNGTPIPDC